MSQKIDEQKKLNVSYKLRNDTLRAEVRDLKQGNAAIEERARSELGMIKEDEVFYQVIDQPILPAIEAPPLALDNQAANTPAAGTSTANTKTPETQVSAKPKE